MRIAKEDCNHSAIATLSTIYMESGKMRFVWFSNSNENRLKSLMCLPFVGTVNMVKGEFVGNSLDSNRITSNYGFYIWIKYHKPTNINDFRVNENENI